MTRGLACGQVHGHREVGPGGQGKVQRVSAHLSPDWDVHAGLAVEGHRLRGPWLDRADPGLPTEGEGHGDGGDGEVRTSVGVGKAQPYLLAAERHVDGLSNRAVGED